MPTMTTPTPAYRAAEPWHPKIRQRSSLRKLQRAEKAFEKVVLRHLAAYLKLTLTTWNSSAPSSLVQEDDPKAAAISLAAQLLQSVDRAYAQQATQFRKDIAEAYQTPLTEGARLGASDLPKNYAFNGHKRFDEDMLVNVDWSLVDPEVLEWADEHSATLVTNVTETTRRRIQAQLEAGIAAGDSRDEIATRIETVMDDVPAWRARLIAQTETIAAHSAGAIQVYKKSGVVDGKRWVDGQAEACPYCEELNGEVVPLDSDFSDGSFAPPQHPGCRCTVAAAIQVP